MLSEALKYAKETTFKKSNLITWALLQVLFHLINWPFHNLTMLDSVAIIVLTFPVMYVTMVLFSLMQQLILKAIR